MAEESSKAYLTLTADTVARHVSNSSVSVGEPPADQRCSRCAQSLGKAEPVQPQQPAVPAGSSVKPEFIVCMED